MPRVFVTQAIDPAGLAVLRDAGLDVAEHRGERPIGRGPLLAAVKGCAGVIPMPTDRIDDAVLATAGLRVVAHHAVGYDNIDLEAAKRRGVIVTNTPGVLTAATADLTLALMLAAARRLVEADQLMRAGAFAGWRPLLLRGLALDGARLGIVGLGRIGRAVARRAAAFGLQTVHCSRSDKPDAGIERVDLETLLATSDIVSLHCPLTAETRHLIDAAALARMKPGAILINTARGPVVDEAALVEALESGHIAAAGLDVFEDEPRAHPGLRALPQAVLAPHIGSATVAARRQMALKAARNMVAALAGDTPPDRIA